MFWEYGRVGLPTHALFPIVWAEGQVKMYRSCRENPNEDQTFSLNMDKVFPLSWEPCDIISLSENQISGYSQINNTDFVLMKLVKAKRILKKSCFILFYSPISVNLKNSNTGHSRYVDFAYLDTTTYIEVIFHSQHFFCIFLCISTPSMSKMVNMKQRVSRGDFSCPRCIF